MLFTITGKHVEITPAIREYAQEKTRKLPRYYNSINQIEVIISGSEGGKPSVEIIARGEHSIVFVARENSEDMYACIDLAVRKLERQLKRKKGKQRNHKHLGGMAEKELSVGKDGEDEEVTEK